MASLISYAQNFEDIVLYRALKGVRDGFYIDVGAQHPVIDSVTKLFYDKGWRGINIEPVPMWHHALEQARPRDINLAVAASSQRGSVHLYEVRQTGLSTTVAEFADRAKAHGFEVAEHEVPTQTLDEICETCHVGEVHFLKIDAEGHEEEVLQGIGLSTVRPWIVTVEAIEPNIVSDADATDSIISTHARWEHLLTERGYELVYRDGLNRFYLAKERASLRPAFATPPNFALDGFIRGTEALLRERIAVLEKELSQRRRVRVLLERLVAMLRRIWRSPGATPLRVLRRMIVRGM